MQMQLAQVLEQTRQALEVPRAPAVQHRAIRAAVAAGASKQQVAADFGLTARQVRRICNELAEADDRQGELF